MAHHPHRYGLAGVGHDPCTLGQHHLGIVREETDELLASLRHEIGARERAFAHEVRLGLADGPVEAGVLGGDRAVGILSDDNVTLLGA